MEAGGGESEGYFLKNIFGYLADNAYLCKLINYQDNEESTIHGVGTAGCGVRRR